MNSKKPQAIYRNCKGAAHQPPDGWQIDNCIVCAPYWGRYPMCPRDGTALKQSGYCHYCHRYANVTDIESDALNEIANGADDWQNRRVVLAMSGARRSMDHRLSIANRKRAGVQDLYSQSAYGHDCDETEWALNGGKAAREAKPSDKLADYLGKGVAA